MLALSTDSLKGYGLNRIFEFAKKAGYQGIDLYLNPNNYDVQDADYLKKLIKEYDLPIVALQQPEARPKIMEKTIALAKEIGCKVIIIQPPKLLNFSQTDWLKKEVPKIRAKENISIALENAPAELILGVIPKHAMNNIAEMRKFKHACIDTTRIAMRQQDLMRTYKSLQKYLVHVHLSNVKGSKKYFLPNDGILPLESFLTKMKQDDFPGNISIKIHPKYLHLDDEEKMIKTLVEIREYYEKYFLHAKID